MPGPWPDEVLGVDLAGPCLCDPGLRGQEDWSWREPSPSQPRFLPMPPPVSGVEAERRRCKMPGQTQGGVLLETSRLVLRPFLLEDVEVLYAFFTHPDVRRFLWDDRIVHREELRGVIAASLDSFSTLGFGQWLAEDRRTRALVGFCGLRPIGQTPEIEILYALVRERWGEGLASEAGNAVLTHAFLRVGLPRVVGRTDSPNLASVRVLERLGMRFEGEYAVHGLPTRHYAISEAAFRERYATCP